MAEPESKLRIAERQVDDITVVSLTGEMVVNDGDKVFGRKIDDLIKAGRIKIVLNLGEVTYVDSAGVGMMVWELKMVRQAGGEMKLAQLTARSHHLLAMMKLRMVFDIFDDEAAAIKSFAWGLRK